MQTHHFTLIIEGPDMQEEAIINALFENGCDDGTIGRSDGIQFIIFDREAASFAEAVQSAIDDIERTLDLKAILIADADMRETGKLVRKDIHNSQAKSPEIFQ